MIDGVGIAAGGFDAQPEQIGERASVAAGGVGLVRDAVFADGPHSELVADLQVLAKQMAASGAASMVCLEMVGYFSDEPGSQKLRPAAARLVEGDEQVVNNINGERRGDFLLVTHRRSSRALADGVRLGAAGADLPIATLQDPRPERWGRRLATLLRPVTSNLDRSDRMPFWNRGIPSIAVTETANLRNPHYHRSSDTADTLDYDRLAALTDAITHLVQHLPDPGEPAGASTPAGRGER